MLFCRMAGTGGFSQTVVDDLGVIYILDEDVPVVEPEPVIPSQTVGSGPVFDSDEDPEEGSYEGDELEGFSDGPLPEQEDVVTELMSKNLDLEDHIQQLEQEVMEQQHSVDQHQALAHYLLARNTELGELVKKMMHEKETLRKEKELIHSFWDEDVIVRLQVEKQRQLAMNRIHDLEIEVRGKNAKMDQMSYAFESAFGRWKDRVQLHPTEKGQSSRVLSRKRMMKIGKEEYRDAKKRGMLRQ